jgi:hypothetical protein
VLSRPLQAKHVLRKKERQEILLQDIARLDLALGMYSSVCILGRSDTDRCVAELRAEAGSSTDAEARELLDRIELLNYRTELVVSTPFTTRMSTAKCQVNVALPAHCPLHIQGCLAQVEIVGMTGSVDVSLSYGGMFLFDTTGDINARTAPEGKIVFSGRRGRVGLRSEGEIDLKLTDEIFQGGLEARTSNEPIRVLLPEHFRSSFEASAPEVICRADIASQTQRHQKQERTVLTFGGAATNAIRLESFWGPIVIDNISKEHSDLGR